MRPLLIVFALFSLLALQLNLNAQTYFGFNAEVNHFFTHSDNDLPVTQINDWQNGLGLEGYIQHPLSEKLTMRLSAGYSYSKIDRAMEIGFTDFSGNTVGRFPVDIDLHLIPVDFSVVGELPYGLTFGIGPSLSWSIRTLNYVQSGPALPLILEDRLAALGFGAHGFGEYRFIFSEESPLFVTAKLRLRYMSALWYQDEERKLRKYESDYFQGALLLGVGWSR